MRLLKAILYTIILCIVTHGYNAQNTIFSKLYNYDNFRDAAASIIETNDGNFLFVGGSSLTGNARNLIVKINLQGDTLWAKQYDLSIGVDNALSVVELANGNFLLAGSLHDTATVTAKGYLMLVNAQGDSLWVKQYGSGNGTNGDNLESVALTPDGGFIVAGYTVLGPSFNTTDAWVFKTDSVGNMLWQKQFDGHGFDDIFEKVIITPDSSIVCAGYTVLNQDTAFDYIVKLNQQGDTLWAKQHGGLGATYDINNTSDSGFIGCGGKYINNAQRLYVYRLDSLGNMLWEKDYAKSNDPSHLYSFAAVHEMHDGNFIAAGVDFDLIQPTVTPRIQLFVVNTLGDSLWSQQYAHSTGTDHDYLFDMKPTSDGGYIMCGYVIHSSPTNNDALVIKVDSIDCINYVNGCQSVGITPSSLERVGVRLYPNPNNGLFTIALTGNEQQANIEVYTLSGQLIQQTQITHKGEIDISEQPSSIYFVKVIQQDKVSMQKIIKN